MGFLHRLVSRSMGTIPTVRPRVDASYLQPTETSRRPPLAPSQVEPVKRGSPLADSTNFVKEDADTTDPRGRRRSRDQITDRPAKQPMDSTPEVDAAPGIVSEEGFTTTAPRGDRQRPRDRIINRSSKPPMDSTPSTGEVGELDFRDPSPVRPADESADSDHAVPRVATVTPNRTAAEQNESEAWGLTESLGLPDIRSKESHLLETGMDRLPTLLPELTHEEGTHNFLVPSPESGSRATHPAQAPHNVPPDVHVTIGRVEVVASGSNQGPPPSTTPRMSLHEYLEKRENS